MRKDGITREGDERNKIRDGEMARKEIERIEREREKERRER